MFDIFLYIVLFISTGLMVFFTIVFIIFLIKNGKELWQDIWK